MSGLDLAPGAELDYRLRALNEAYGACLDDRQLENWPSFFTEDAFYRVTSRENFDSALPLSEIYCDGIGMIRDRAAAILNTTIYDLRPIRHIIGGSRLVKIVDGQMETRTNFALLESPSAQEPRVLMVGRYFDRLVARNDALLFSERSCVYDNYRINTTLIFPV
jgi:anthranilate 1,2-dioxygenase small subunit